MILVRRSLVDRRIRYIVAGRSEKNMLYKHDRLFYIFIRVYFVIRTASQKITHNIYIYIFVPMDVLRKVTL